MYSARTFQLRMELVEISDADRLEKNVVMVYYGPSRTFTLENIPKNAEYARIVETLTANATPMFMEIAECVIWWTNDTPRSPIDETYSKTDGKAK